MSTETETAEEPTDLTPRQEWLHRRASRITSTDAGTILGLTEWGEKTPYSIWRRITTGERVPVEVNWPMRRGTLMEPVVVAESGRLLKREILTGANVDLALDHVQGKLRLYGEGTGDVFSIIEGTGDNDFLCYSPDGFVVDRERDPDSLGIFEAKTCRDSFARAWQHDGPATEADQRKLRQYRAQVSVAMAVTGIRWGYFGVVPIGDVEPFVEPFEWAAFDGWAIANLRAWWEKHVIGGVEPEVIAEDIPLLAASMPEIGKTVVTAFAPALEDEVAEYLELRVRRTDWNREADALTKQLKATEAKLLHAAVKAGASRVEAGPLAVNVKVSHVAEGIRKAYSRTTFTPAK